jgi:uncharacterized protein (TIGR03067 family)
MSVADPQSAVPKPRLRWYQYRLRILLFVMVCTLPCIWLTGKMWQAKTSSQRLAFDQTDPRVVAEHKTIAGIWTAVKVQRGEEAGCCDLQLTFDFGRVVLITSFDGDNEKELRGAYWIDPTTEPKQIDFFFPDLTLLGAYDFKGSVLRLSVSPLGHPRPTALEPSRHNKNLVYYLETQIRE